MSDLSGLYTTLLGGGALAALGTILSTRSSRQRDYDARMDKELDTTRTDLERVERDRDEIKGERDSLRAEVSMHAIEETRLIRLLVENGIDPNPPLRQRGGRELT